MENDILADLVSYGLATAQEKTEIQTLILSKKKFKTVKDASDWVRKHGFKVHKVDETKNSFRFRQKDPSEFKKGSLRTINLTAGVSAVVGRPK